MALDRGFEDGFMTRAMLVAIAHGISNITCSNLRGG